MRMPALRRIVATLALLTTSAIHVTHLLGQSAVSPSIASSALAATITAMVAEPAVVRAHWGVMVTTMDGSPIFALNEGQLFQPASNTKLFTTAAALAFLSDATFETKVIATGRFTDDGKLDGDLVLIGDGDANLSGRPVPYLAPGAPVESTSPLRYLDQLADAVAASGLKSIQGDIVGDDTRFPWQPYATDWAIDDAVWGYGAPVSALTINDNQLRLIVRPGAKAGASAEVTLDPAIPYYVVDASGLTTGPTKSGSSVEIKRAIGSKLLRIYGSIAVGSTPDVEEIAIEDPAEYAATALKSKLEARGIVISGAGRARHRLSTDTTGFLSETRLPVAEAASPAASSRVHADDRGLAAVCKGCEGAIPPDPKGPAKKLLASHVSSTVAEDVVITNKESQNLHAELLLRQLGAAVGTDGTVAQGARVVRSFLLNAGIDKEDFVFYDGSGMSGHDLVTPRAVVKLLQFATARPWFATYKSSLPIGGVDGTLALRFTKAPLKGRVFAKTGSNSETRALSGYLECASGKSVIFSIMTGNHKPGSNADRDVMDRIVAAVAAAN